MKRSAVLALACTLALASFCATASAREQSEEYPEDKCERVEYDSYYGHEHEYEPKYDCYEKEDYKGKYYYCCEKKTPAPTYAPTKAPTYKDKCERVEYDSYYGHEHEYEPKYDCYEKEDYKGKYYYCCEKKTPAPTYAPTKAPTYKDKCERVEYDTYYGHEHEYEPKYHCYEKEDYKGKYYYCCEKKTPAPTPAPTKPYNDCKKVSKHEYYGHKHEYEYSDCTKIVEKKKKEDRYGHSAGYYYYTYYKCCPKPKPTPAPTAAPTPKPYVAPQPKCYTKHYKTCCKVYGKKDKKQYKKDGYSCSSLGRSYYEKKYVCCKQLPKPTHPKPVCYTKKFGYKSYKCCYDHEKKYKKDKKYKCFYDSYKGHKGYYCYKKD